MAGGYWGWGWVPRTQGPQSVSGQTCGRRWGSNGVLHGPSRSEDDLERRPGTPTHSQTGPRDVRGFTPETRLLSQGPSGTSPQRTVAGARLTTRPVQRRDVRGEIPFGLNVSVTSSTVSTPANLVARLSRPPPHVPYPSVPDLRPLRGGRPPYRTSSDPGRSVGGGNSPVPRGPCRPLVPTSPSSKRPPGSVWD